MAHMTPTVIVVLQTKYKLCDISNTTYVYPITTTAVAKTSFRSRGLPGEEEGPATADPPTSAPTEGRG